MLKTNHKGRNLNWVLIALVLAFVAGCNTVNVPEFGGTVKDIDGNEYHTVTIGPQTWMIENLKTTWLNDSTQIVITTDSAAWTNLKSPGYCWYGNDSVANKNVYGALYNWYAVNTGKLAPQGWHVPTEEDWNVLENNVNDYLYTAGSLSKTLAAASNWVASTRSGAIGNNLAKNNISPGERGRGRRTGGAVGRFAGASLGRADRLRARRRARRDREREGEREDPRACQKNAPTSKDMVHMRSACKKG